MRLTLRTMLCYLDDVLDPADAKELGQKIEESEYATNVVHRVRSSMRRLRLGAPAVSGKEMGFDPNTVADYLDNTLAPEQVADFERVCLDVESESHLAEVAACHQILTLVLGEPAEVPLSMRHRIYGLGHLDEQQLAGAALNDQQGDIVEPPIQANTASQDAHRRVDPPEPGTDSDYAAAGQDASAKTERHKPEIPEYLRQGSSQRTWPMALAVLLLVILLGGIVTFWPPGGNQANNVAVNGEEEGEGEREGEDEPDAPDPLFSVDNGSSAATDGAAVPAIDENQNPADIVDDTNPAANPTDIAANVPPAIAGETPAEPVSPPVAPAGGTDEPVDDREGEAVARVDPSADAGEPVLPPVDKVAAHFISSSQVMVGWDAESAAWRRLPPRAQLKPGDRFRSFPTYRPQVLLTNDIQITFADECAGAIGNPVDGLPFIHLSSGKTVIATMGKAGNALVLNAGGRQAVLTMADSEAVIALSVTPFHLPGDNPETDMAHVEVAATVTSGQVQWRQDGAEPVLLDFGQQISMLDDGLPRVQNASATPKWEKSNDISDIDRLASATLEPMLDDERPIEIALAEKAEHPRVEVRSLAARSLASIDRFDALIDSFDDESLKSYWSEHFDRLQSAMARGPQTATHVRESIERRKGEDGERIYRLLQGYSPQQLQEGADRTLVDYLQHESLDVRVLAINNLRRITSRTFGYHPHLPELRRRTAQREWEQAAQGGTIAYLKPPPELPKRERAP